MNIKLRRIVASLLAGAAIGVNIPENGVLYADAAEIISSGECGDNASWTLDSDGLLTISGTGAIADTMFGETPWDNAAVKKAVIKSGITSIERTAFNGNENMTEIEIADTVTSIGNFAFLGCESLNTVSIPYKVSELGVGVFAFRENLESIETDSRSVYLTDEDGILFTKDKKKLICFPKAKDVSTYIIPYGVETIGNSAFYNCDQLTGVEIPKTVTVLDIDSFAECGGLTSIAIPESVNEIGEYSFSRCESLKTVFIYNPDCEIFDGSATICNTSEVIDDGTFNITHEGSFSGTVYSYAGSTAQSYAEKYGYNFRAIKSYEFQLGDVNIDGAIDALDASLTLMEYASVSTGKPSELDDIEKLAADTDHDGNINALDASYILSYYAHTATGGKGTFEEFMK